MHNAISPSFLLIPHHETVLLFSLCLSFSTQLNFQFLFINPLLFQNYERQIFKLIKTFSLLTLLDEYLCEELRLFRRRIKP